MDNFGIGANVAQELALSKIEVNAVNSGDEPDSEDFLNKRAEMAWRLKQWIRTGGELVRHGDWKQFLGIRYRRELSGKMKLMSKLDMAKLGIPSPDAFDAACLTFWRAVDVNVETGMISSYPEHDDINVSEVNRGMSSSPSGF